MVSQILANIGPGNGLVFYPLIGAKSSSELMRIYCQLEPQNQTT